MKLIKNITIKKEDLEALKISLEENEKNLKNMEESATYKESKICKEIVEQIPPTITEKIWTLIQKSGSLPEKIQQIKEQIKKEMNIELELSPNLSPNLSPDLIQYILTLHPDPLKNCYEILLEKQLIYKVPEIKKEILKLSPDLRDNLRDSIIDFLNKIETEVLEILRGKKELNDKLTELDKKVTELDNFKQVENNKKGLTGIEKKMLEDMKLKIQSEIQSKRQTLQILEEIKDISLDELDKKDENSLEKLKLDIQDKIKNKINNLQNERDQTFINGKLNTKVREIDEKIAIQKQKKEIINLLAKINTLADIEELETTLKELESLAATTSTSLTTETQNEINQGIEDLKKKINQKKE